ncbi:MULTISPECIES: hypothetical protein [unclassified Sinorhizobium]|uniref:hypothetical protein n=1 Tax=unclassified Sinorhizobium TaxID=2613772 RepID=UPI0024C21E05|nr:MULTISPECIES: hypothetical protein [unclassified Sinorhizobium]MDK1377692.1 hypothetical protein [Sinorhizobium sp. 6-70]MDK1478652.1 hypothetical protein [Sinorhizobium sp. 6-117]
MWAILVGVFLFVCGMLFMAREALGRRQLSNPSPRSYDGIGQDGIGQDGIGQEGTGPTLEPEQQGLGFLGLARNWPGLVLMAIGAVFLLFG